MIVLLFTFMILYFLSILLLIYGFDKIRVFEVKSSAPKTKFSIIVPFRNENDNLPVLLESLSNLNYPTDFFEVILVDDASEFRFKNLKFRFKIAVIDNVRISNSPKKDAISTAIPLAEYEWIVTTDADCTVKKDWLLVLDQFIQQQNPEMICGAVTYNCQNTFMHQFQQLDLASLQGATIGSFGIKKPFMCNGANFAYTKKIFEKLNGFEGNNKIASGDDVFLLQKAIEQFPKKVMYLKNFDAVVNTKPQDNWKDLFHQRVRWASKTKAYKSNFGKILGLIVFFGNLAFIFFLFRIWNLEFRIWNLFLGLLLLKIYVDIILIQKTQNFLQSKTKYILLSSLLYPFFSVAVVVYSFFGKYEWKGRRFF
jgi:cellulose synthase/poly-beta-1,6-N-acetylglucosamine synthase-like glycosyltransferase